MRTPLLLPRFYPILDPAACERAGLDPEEAARGLVGAGAGIVQFRWKGPYTRAAFELAQRIGGIVRAAGALYVLNDRADIALLVEADGVHVGQTDLPPEAVRRVVGEKLFVGLSTHNEAQLIKAGDEPIDCVALGPIFGTASKENPDPRVGLEELRRLAPLAKQPLIAIGGVTLEAAPEALAAGAASCAVISDWMRGDWRKRVELWTKI